MKKELSINRNIAIVRDYSSGSNATTLLCMDGNSTFFRKYAFEVDGKKLSKQIEWIEANKNVLAVPEIIRKDVNDEYCYYDMAYNRYSIGMLEYAHSMPVNKTWNQLYELIQSLEKKLYVQNTSESKIEDIRKYYEEKLEKNIALMLADSNIASLQSFKTLIINGEEYFNLKYYESMLSEESLVEIFSNDKCSNIHGDLTIENVICTRDDSGNEYSYLIDPNPENIHNSKNLDYAKLLQSLHGEYEFVKSSKDIVIKGNTIDFNYTHSVYYKELYELLLEYMNEQFDARTIKSIFYHEIINWMRLIPYQIRLNSQNGLVCYARMLMLLKDISNRFS